MGRERKMTKKRIENLLELLKSDIESGRVKGVKSWCDGRVANIFSTAVYSCSAVTNGPPLRWIYGDIDKDLVACVYDEHVRLRERKNKLERDKKEMKNKRTKQKKIGLYGGITVEEKERFDKICKDRGTKMSEFICSSIRRALCENDISFAYYEPPKKKRKWYWPF